jgi:hypothetical protein
MVLIPFEQVMQSEPLFFNGRHLYPDRRDSSVAKNAPSE